MNTYSKWWAQPATPQTTPLPGRTMVRNAAGGFAFQVSDWERLDRFLILGSESGTYYVTAQALTVSNAAATVRCIEQEGRKVVLRIAELHSHNRLPKLSPALFALALCSRAPDTLVRMMAFTAAKNIVRTGSQLFEFVAYRESLGGGWGRQMRRFVSEWYKTKSSSDLVYQLLKYQQRNGWSQRDLLRLAKPVPEGALQSKLFGWAVGKVDYAKALDVDTDPDLLIGWLFAKEAKDAATVAKTVARYGLTWEMLESQWLKAPEVWAALLDRMPATALLRNLGRMTAIGTLGARSEAEKLVVTRLVSQEWVRKGRLHPIAILNAMRVYRQGRGDRGHLAWSPSSMVLGALEQAFYNAFSNIRPIQGKLLVALDCSGSMLSASVLGMEGLKAAEAGAAMLMSLLAAQPEAITLAFDTKALAVDIRNERSLEQVMHQAFGKLGGGTDLAQPMHWALHYKKQVDAFVVLTDNETWAGPMHTSEVLEQYRREVNPQAKLVVCALSATHSTVGDNEPNTLQAVGLDAALPEIIRGFVDGYDSHGQDAQSDQGDVEDTGGAEG